MNPEIVDIAIEELVIDVVNIRQGIWDGDPEIIDSVKNGGIRQPLLVRPIISSDSKQKYGIVAGSRRYNAAIIAGLDRVPCIIREMDDIEAMEESMIENRQRSPTPRWRDIEYVGVIYYKLIERGASHSEAIGHISKKGIRKDAVERYIKIYDLPEEIKGLLRSPEDRTISQREALKLFSEKIIKKEIHIKYLMLLHQIRDLPVNKQIETAILIHNKLYQTAEEIITEVKKNPSKEIKEIYNKLIEKSGRKLKRTLHLSDDTEKALTTACLTKQTFLQPLILKILEDWLKDNHFL